MKPLPIPATVPPHVVPGTRRTTQGALLGLNGGALNIREGASDATMGTAVLAGGSVVVPTKAVRADSRIHLTTQAPSGTPGSLIVSARTPGVSFQINSSSGADNSSVAWVILAPQKE